MQAALSSIFQRRHKKVEERLFMPSGPLGSFAVKIDLVHLLGLLSADGYHDMVIMKDIRNAFAHRLGIRDFKTPTIRDRCLNLRMIETHVGDTKFQAGESILSLAPDDRPRLRVFNYARKKKQPRQRYLVTAQLITISFALIRSIRFPLPVV
jgi:DNA-binding MltR family transcriptional regulator